MYSYPTGQHWPFLLHVFRIMWQRTKLKLGHRSICVDYKHCVEYCMHDFKNFNDLCLPKNTIVVAFICNEKNKQNLFFHNIDFYSVQNMKKFLGIAYI